jgi:AraC family transcriptional regulator
MTEDCTTVSPTQWAYALGASPDLCSAEQGRWSGALLRRWHDTSARMEQPPLDHHYLVLHLGGAKRVHRQGLHSIVTADAEANAMTLVTAGTSFSWKTDGPIGFAHLYLRPHAIDHVVAEEFDRDARAVDLIDCVARRLPLLSALMSAMLGEIETPTFGSRLILDTLLHSLVVRMLSECSTLSEIGNPAPHAISPRRLRRVLEFIEANLGTDLELEDLASVAGSSRFHFSRAFREATGFPPYRYLIHRRIDAAKTLLLEDTYSIPEIADRCGFNSRNQFAAMFKQAFGISPTRFRREH